MHPTLRILASGLAAVCLCGSAAGASPAMTPEEIAGAAKTDSLSVPMPGEFMAALNKLGKLDWSAKFRPPVATNFTSRPQSALNLGGLIADGYIAIEAADGPQVKNIGKDVLALAKVLGVSKEVLERSNSIAGFAENNQWDQLKEEMEATQNEVKSAMTEAKDQDLVTLVTVGGWLRGTEVVSGHVAKNYSVAGAQLLRQPGIVAFLNGRLDGMPEKVREEAVVRGVRKKMTELASLVGFPADRAPTVDDVKKINALAAEVVKDMARKETK